MEQKTEFYQYAFYLKGICFVKRVGFVNHQIQITKDNISLIYSNQDKLILKPLYLDKLLFDINKCPFSILVKLAELNYDIFNLIPNNLAINFYSC